MQCATIGLVGIGCWLLGAGAARAQAAQERTAQEPTARTAAAETTRYFPDWWMEDDERRARALEFCMTPDDYLAAFQSTGMAAALVANGGAGAPSGGVGQGSTGAPQPTTSWMPIGPRGNFAPGPGGERNGRVAGLQIHPTAGGRLYVGATIGGIWRSDLASVGTWTPIGNGLANPSVRALAVHPTNPNHILAGTGDWNRWGGAGLFESTNGGATWSPVPLQPVTPGYFHRILFHPSDPNIKLAASSDGLWRCNGTTWTRVTGGHFTDVVVHPTSPNIWFATGFGQGLWKSVSDGVFWSPVFSPNFPSLGQWGRSVIAICRNTPNTMVILVERNNVLEGLYRSTDGGATWFDLSGNLGATWAFGSEAGHALAVAIKPDDPNTIFAAARGLAITQFGGLLWQDGFGEHGIYEGHVDFTQLQFSPITGNDTLWMTNDGGIYRVTLSTKTTTSVIGGVNGLQISEIDYLDADRAVRAIGMQDNGNLITTNGGATWIDANGGGGDGGWVGITDPVAGDFWFGIGLYSTPSSGWRLHRKNFGSGSEWIQNHPDKGLCPFFYDPFGGRIYSHNDSVILSIPKTTSATGTWTVEITSGFGQAAPYNMRRIWGSRANGRSLFVTYWDLVDEDERDLTIFERPGATWIPHHSEDLVPPGARIEVVAPSTEWPGACWIGVASQVGEPKVLSTTDYGASWQDVSGELSAVGRVMTIASTPFDPLTLYAGTDLGIHRTTDGGQSWQPFQTGLPNGPVWHLEFVPNDAKGSTHVLVAGVKGRGVWEHPIAASPILYADESATGTMDGSFERPYATVAAAVAAAPAGSIVALRADTYQEPQTITKNVRVVTWAGSSVIR